MPDESMNQDETTLRAHASARRIFRAQPRYLVLALLSLAASVMLLLEMRQGVAWDSGLFAIIGLAGGVWAGWMASTRVELLDGALVLRRLFLTQRVDYPQIISISTQGRLLNVLTLLYHPRRQDGLVDTDSVRSLLAPGVTDQDELLDALEGKTPA